MIAYIIRRLLTGLSVLLAVTSATFFLFNIRGGMSIARGLLPVSDGASEEMVRQKAESLGLLRPFVIQYGDWLFHTLTGDLGRSWIGRQPVADALLSRFPVTASLIVVSLALTILLALPFGIAAARRGGVVDRLLQLLAVVVQAIPGYWLALILVIVFALTLRLFPATGFIPITQSATGWLHSIFLPSLAIATGAVAFVAMQIRGSMVDVMNRDWVRTLRSRGLPERSVVYKHALRDALPPVLTILSLQVIGLLSGAVLVEQIYALPGLGTLALTSGTAGDIPMVLGVVVVLVTGIVVINLLTDVINGLVNPKARVR